MHRCVNMWMVGVGEGVLTLATVRGVPGVEDRVESWEGGRLGLTHAKQLLLEHCTRTHNSIASQPSAKHLAAPSRKMFTHTRCL